MKCPECGHTKIDKNILPSGDTHKCCRKCHCGWVNTPKSVQSRGQRMSNKPELKPCPFRHIEKDYEHELSVIKDPEKHGLARVCCCCGYRSPVMGFDKESVIEAHNSLADLAKPSEWISAILKQAESMIGSPTEDDLQKFIDWLWAEYLPSPPTRETP